MRGFVIIAVAALSLASCRTQKEVQTDVAVIRDSVAVAETHRTLAVIDSALANMTLAFDTLTVTVERPSAAETVRLKAVGARLFATSSRHVAAVATAMRTDSAGVAESHIDKSVEKATSVGAYNPPNMMLILTIVCALVVMALLVYFRKI